MEQIFNEFKDRLIDCGYIRSSMVIMYLKETSGIKHTLHMVAKILEVKDEKEILDALKRCNASDKTLANAILQRYINWLVIQAKQYPRLAKGLTKIQNNLKEVKWK